MPLFFISSGIIQVDLLLKLHIATFAITLLGKQNNSGIISESGY